MFALAQVNRLPLRAADSAKTPKMPMFSPRAGLHNNELDR